MTLYYTRYNTFQKKKKKKKKKKTFGVCFRAGLGSVWDMNLTEVAMFALLLIILLNQILIARIMSRIIGESMYSLDLKLAEAITSAFETVPDLLRENMSLDFEPPNPIQALISQAIMKKMGGDQNITEIPRTNDGKFKPQG